MPGPWEKYQTGPWQKYGGEAPSSQRMSLEGAKVSADPKPTGLREKAERWAQNVQNDIRHGTDLTGVGAVMKFLGAHGIDYGTPEKVGEYMASLPLGFAQMAEGGAQASQGKLAEGGKNLVAGALHAAEMPANFVGSPTTAEGVGAAGMATKAADKVLTTGEKMKQLIPSAERAGGKFSAVMGAAHSVPIDVSAPGAVALDIQKLAESGSTRPKVIGDFLKRVTDPDKGPLTYQEARDFYTNASRLSAGESMKLTPVMKRQVAMFTQNLNEAIEQAAAHVGKLDEYQSAMNEYHKAMQLRAIGDAVKDIAKNKAVQTAVGTGAGYALSKEILK